MQHSTDVLQKSSYQQIIISFSKIIVVALLLATTMGLMPTQPAMAQEPALADQLRALSSIADEGVEAAAQNNASRMQHEYDELNEKWESFEDALREQNPTTYVEMENALQSVRDALQVTPVDPVTVQQAFEHLMDEANEQAEKFGGGTSVAAAQVNATPADMLQKLENASAKLATGEPGDAGKLLEEAIRIWPSIEGTIATKSNDAYTAIEVDLGRASSALKASPANVTEATAALGHLQSTLSPFVERQTYTVFDAATIILREGLEALLVIVALLAFLQRSGNSDKRRWIWIGSAVGVVASIGVAVILQTIFSRATAGQDREVVEGVTGIIAAGLLFYVAYWLHNKSNINAWRKYINTRTTQALARGSIFGLAFLSFLAVFREGAETAVFYLGMVSAISLQNLALGLSLGVGILVLVAILVLRVGMKLPLRPFFRVAGALVYYLGFKFLGTGIHALQVSNVLPTSAIKLGPTIPFFGIYPTWESIGPQLLLLAAAGVVYWYIQTQERQMAHQSSEVSL